MDFLFLCFIALLAVVIFSLVRSLGRKHALTKALASLSSHNYDPISLYQVDPLVLQAYGKNLTHSMQLALDHYRTTCTQAEEHFGRITTADFRTTLSAAEEELQQYSTLFTGNNASSPAGKEKLITSITSLQDTQNQLTEYDRKFSHLESELLRAPETITQLLQECVNAHRRIGISAQTYETLQTKFPPSVLKPLENHISLAKKYWETAQNLLENAQKQVKAGENAVVFSLHVVSESLEKISTLLTEIDNAHSKIATAQITLPETIAYGENLLAKAHKLVSPITEKSQQEITSTIELLQQHLAYAKEHGESDPLTSYSQLNSTIQLCDAQLLTFTKTIEQQRSYQEQLRHAINAASSSIKTTSEYLTSLPTPASSTASAQLSQARNLLHEAHQGLSPEADRPLIERSLELVSQANQLNQEAYSSARNSYGFYSPQQIAATPRGNFAGSFLGTMLGGLAGEMIFDSLHHHSFDNQNFDASSWNSFDSFGNDGSGDY